jgi:hypothetical protein
MKVIAKEYEALHQSLYSQRKLDIEVLSSKGQLLKEVRVLRENIKAKKRDIADIQDKISSEEFQRVRK